MMSILFITIALIGGIGIGVLVNYLIARSKGNAILRKAKDEAESLKKAKMLEAKPSMKKRLPNENRS